ncbi:MAG: DUF4190 domain-containing protein [Microbacteriaceae bacterium]
MAPGVVFQPGVPMPPAPGLSGRSGKAVAAMVLGIVGVVLCFTGIPAILALIFGLIARSEIRRSGGRLTGSGMAIAGIVLGIVGIAIGIAFYVAAALGAFDDDNAVLSGIDVGDCVRVPDDGLFFGLREQGCDRPHEGEVFLTGELEGAGRRTYPGESEVQADIRERCFREFEDYLDVSYEESAYDFAFVYPSERNWRRDDGGYACIAFDVTGADLEGSVEGSGR